ncbi:MAG: lipopolysaccharide heptosyltransferase II [Acidobacteria bacterium]|nr:lipopolysaccharide heptosyltransferase II [Acidobacteriota bacterium]
MEVRRLNILVRGTNWLGDAVMSIPALVRLRRHFPDAHITVLSSPVARGIYVCATQGRTPVADEILVHNSKERRASGFLRTVKALRNRRFDLAILFQNAFEAALLAWVAGIPSRIGYDAQGRGILLTDKIMPLNSPRHQIHDYIQLVDAARLRFSAEEMNFGNYRGDLPPSPDLCAGPEQKEAAHRLLNGINAECIVALNIGATNSEAKRWPDIRFAELADRMVEEYGVKIVLLGTQAERAIAERVLEKMTARGVINLVGRTDLEALVGVLDRCDLVVGNDTGSAHVAAALGRPTLTLFGPTNEFETAPIGPRAEVVRIDGVDCARCMFRTCPIDHRCMTGITTDLVLERARRHLNR